MRVLHYNIRNGCFQNYFYTCWCVHVILKKELTLDWTMLKISCVYKFNTLKLITPHNISAWSMRYIDIYIYIYRYIWINKIQFSSWDNRVTPGHGEPLAKDQFGYLWLRSNLLWWRSSHFPQVTEIVSALRWPWSHLLRWHSSHLSSGDHGHTSSGDVVTFISVVPG